MTDMQSQAKHLNPNLGRPIDILLVEDSPSDRALTVTALQEGKIINRIFIAVDGEAAMASLRREGEYADRPRPDLVLLDLNLPKKDGRAVLTEMKADPTLRTIPVVVLTTSSDEADIFESYRLQAAGYVTKPVALEEFLQAVQGIQEFWLALVMLPKVHAAHAAAS